MRQLDLFAALQSSTEGIDTEFKSARGGMPGSFWESYVAMANTQGGTIVLGVAEKASGLVWEGVPDAAQLRSVLWSQLNDRHKISANLLRDDDVRTVDDVGRQFVLVNVPRASRLQRPVFVGPNPMTGTYRRAQEGDYRCSDDEVRRMLADPRAAALTKSFGSLYLWVRNVGAQTPASQVYPNFDEILRNAMSREMEMFFDSIRGEDRSVLELLDAKYTFVNERLAKHDGITGVKGAEFRRVALADDSPRRGILGKGSLLLVTSVPQRTSPVKRGKWVLDNVLGAPPPPPPANVPPLADAKTNDGRILTIRELMAKHRANPVCAACHSVIDPVGFALEQFDATGKWRDVDASFTKIEPTGTMPDGSKFSTLTEFRSLITQRPDPFLRTFTDKLLMYALGRGSEPFDAPTVRTVVAGAKANNYKFSSLVLGIVKSTPFQMRRAVEAPKPSGLSASR